MGQSTSSNPNPDPQPKLEPIRLKVTVKNCLQEGGTDTDNTITGCLNGDDGSSDVYTLSTPPWCTETTFFYSANKSTSTVRAFLIHKGKQMAAKLEVPGKWGDIEIQILDDGQTIRCRGKESLPPITPLQSWKSYSHFTSPSDRHIITSYGNFRTSAEDDNVRLIERIPEEPDFEWGVKFTNKSSNLVNTSMKVGKRMHYLPMIFEDRTKRYTFKVSPGDMVYFKLSLSFVKKAVTFNMSVQKNIDVDVEIADGRVKLTEHLGGGTSVSIHQEWREFGSDEEFEQFGNQWARNVMY